MQSIKTYENNIKAEMICILSQNQDPFFNLAAEEFLLKNSPSEYFMLWRCDATIVVGKHQNTLAEINYPYVKKNNIRVARRLTGGGTVFHDLGNINFTFIQEGEKGKLVDFKRFITPVLEMLEGLGIRAEQGMKNEILLHGKKISGNAEHVYKSRILHHGTLLFNSELHNLSEALKVIPGKYKDKAVQSNRSQVTNIQQYLSRKMNTDDFMLALFSSFKNSSLEINEYVFNQTDIRAIEKLVTEKYNTWDWIYGYSPKYSFENKASIINKWIGIELNVDAGIIQLARITGSYIGNYIASRVAETLIGKKHKEDHIMSVLKHQVPKDTPNNEIEMLADAFF